MIVSMLMLGVVMFTFLCVSYDAIPIWLKIVLYAIIFISNLIAYASEDNLRDKIKHLENEVENLKKGGE